MVTQSASRCSSELSLTWPAFRHPLLDPRTAVKPISSELRNLHNSDAETLFPEQFTDRILDLLLVIADGDDIGPHFCQDAQQIKISVAEDGLVDSSERTYKFSSLT